MTAVASPAEIDIAEAAARFVVLLGEDRVEAIDGRAIRLRPTKGEEIGEIIRLAAEIGIPVTVRSSTGTPRSGRSHFDGVCIWIDLSELARIVTVDGTDRVGIVEAGVTWVDFAREAEACGVRACHPLLPPPGKSAVASVFDREPQMVPKYHWDSSDPLLCAEIYFGTGDRFRTGGAAGPGDTLEEQWQAGMHQKNPLGPAQTDLIKIVQGSQGTMGIAAWASIRLERLPSIRKYVIAESEALEPLTAFTSALTRRRIGDEILIFNRSQIQALSAGLGIDSIGEGSDWMLIATIGSLPRLPEESLKYQLDELADLAKLEQVRWNVAEASGDVAWVERVFSTDGGSPDGRYWKQATAGAFREVQFLTSLDRGATLSEEAVSVFESAGFDRDSVGIYIQPLSQGRACHVEVTGFTAADSDSIEAFDISLESAAENLAEAGAFFSRPAGAVARVAFRRAPDTTSALRKVQGILDPAGIFRPGTLFDQVQPNKDGEQ